MFTVFHGCLRQIMLLLLVMPALVDIIRGAGILFLRVCWVRRYTYCFKRTTGCGLH